MALNLNEIGTPVHAHGVRTPTAYIDKQRGHIHALMEAHPGYAWREPWVAPDGAQPFVSAGRWVVMCSCHNGPSASPEWDLACCFECGAIYRAMAWPVDRLEIEAVLMAMPQRARQWTPDEPEKGQP